MWMRIVLLGAAAASLTGPTDVKAAPGVNCPVVKCMAPNCPTSQQETPKDANGCTLCPVCKGVSTVPPVLTSAGASDCALILCLADTKCVNGKCVPNGKGGGKSVAIPPVSDCALILCLPNTKCVDGKCVPTGTGGKGPTDLTGVACPMVMCAKPPPCPVPLETPTVNGCRTCPRCPCKCGESCTMFGGGTGTCQVNGDCAVNIQKPNCPKNCVCGESCKMENGVVGVCQAGGECAINKMKPVCPVLCTREAKTCPDGSSVGRVPPKCEFAPCPKCVCGSACKTKALKPGICQPNGKCLPGKKKAPVCPKGPTDLTSSP